MEAAANELGGHWAAAYQELQPAVVRATARLSQSVVVFSALERLLGSGSEEELDAVQRRVVEVGAREMTLSGCALTGEARDIFNRNLVRLAELQTAFSNNVLDATKAFRHLATRKSEVAGLLPAAHALYYM